MLSDETELHCGPTGLVPGKRVGDTPLRTMAVIGVLSGVDGLVMWAATSMASLVLHWLADGLHLLVESILSRSTSYSEEFSD
jgi:hypothetical protein